MDGCPLITHIIRTTSINTSFKIAIVALPCQLLEVAATNSEMEMEQPKVEEDMERIAEVQRAEAEFLRVEQDREDPE